MVSGSERYAAAELEESGVEIPVAIRKRILDAYHALEGKDHYRLLGVSRTADRAQIRTAYFKLARVFHPDSQFGKQLGTFKGKMEGVFGKLAEAYEVLRRQNRRAEYDEYLAVADRTREAHAALAEGQRVGVASEPAVADPRRAREVTARAARGHTERIAKHIAAANRAERKGELLAAANEYQCALALDPERGDLQLECERVSKLVASSLADDYEKQARYEEKAGNWAAAAESWAKVSDARPVDAAAARAAAEATLKAHGGLHRAQRYAQKAVRLGGTAVANLTVLARVYLDAGLRLNAQRELEKAAELDPADETVKNLLRAAR